MGEGQRAGAWAGAHISKGAMVTVTDGEGSRRVFPYQIPKTGWDVSRPYMGEIQAEVKATAKDRAKEPVPQGTEAAEFIRYQRGRDDGRGQ